MGSTTRRPRQQQQQQAAGAEAAGNGGWRRLRAGVRGQRTGTRLTLTHTTPLGVKRVVATVWAQRTGQQRVQGGASAGQTLSMIPEAWVVRMFCVSALQCAFMCCSAALDLPGGCTAVRLWLAVLRHLLVCVRIEQLSCCCIGASGSQSQARAPENSLIHNVAVSLIQGGFFARRVAGFDFGPDRKIVGFVDLQH